jgi:hypothetical protein
MYFRRAASFEFALNVIFLFFYDVFLFIECAINISNNNNDMILVSVFIIVV